MICYPAPDRGRAVFQATVGVPVNIEGADRVLVVRACVADPQASSFRPPQQPPEPKR